MHPVGMKQHTSNPGSKGFKPSSGQWHDVSQKLMPFRASTKDTMFIGNYM